MHRMSLTLAFALVATFTSFLLQVVSASLPRAASDPHALSGPPSGYAVVPVTWRTEVNGQKHEINGTAEDFWSQIKVLDPERQLKKRSLSARATLNKVHPALCVPVPGQSWHQGFIPDVEKSIGYLIGIAEPLIVGPGPGVCGLLNCMSGSRIWLCNDNPYAIQPESDYLGSYATDIIEQCQVFDGTASHIWFAGGQEFDTDRYNVVVNGDGLGVESGPC